MRSSQDELDLLKERELYRDIKQVLQSAQGVNVTIDENGQRSAKVFRKPEEYLQIVKSGDWNEYVMGGGPADADLDQWSPRLGAE